MTKSPRNPPHPSGVGFGRPPVHSRFPAGISGNPKGRPKRSKNLKTIIQSVLNAPIPIREGDKRRTVSKVEAVVLRQVEGALKGDGKAALAVLRMAAQVGLLDRAENHDDQKPLSAAEQQIVDEILAATSPPTKRGRRG